MSISHFGYFSAAIKLIITKKVAAGIIHDDELLIGNISTSGSRYLLIPSSKEELIKFEFKDLYGNQICRGHRDNDDSKMLFESEPPVLVMRTNRIRYRQ
jgi:hypothetical protein